MTEHRPSSDIAFTPAVKAIQTTKGSRQSYARMESRGGWQNTVTTEIADFIAELDMFYLGTANGEGQIRQLGPSKLVREHSKCNFRRYISGRTTF